MDLWLLGFSFFFGFDPVLVWGVFDVFWGLRWISLCFPWSSWWKSVNCGFWRTSGRFRGTFGVYSWYLGFSSGFFWVILFLFDMILTCFEVSVGFCWVLVGQYVK